MVILATVLLSATAAIAEESLFAGLHNRKKFSEFQGQIVEAAQAIVSQAAKTGRRIAEPEGPTFFDELASEFETASAPTLEEALVWRMGVGYASDRPRHGRGLFLASLGDYRLIPLDRPELKGDDFRRSLRLQGVVKIHREMENVYGEYSAPVVTPTGIRFDGPGRTVYELRKSRASVWPGLILKETRSDRVRYAKLFRELWDPRKRFETPPDDRPVPAKAPPPPVASRRALQEALRETEVRLARASVEVARLRKLAVEGGAVSEKQLQTAIAEYEAARDSVTAARQAWASGT